MAKAILPHRAMLLRYKRKHIGKRTANGSIIVSISYNSQRRKR